MSTISAMECWPLRIPGGGPLPLVAETALGQLVWRERAVGRLLTAPTQGGDIVRCADVRRMARST